MIKARAGLRAVFRVKSGGAKARTIWVGDRKVELKDGEATVSFVVEAWDDDGDALCLHDGKLVPACRLGNFLGVENPEDDEEYARKRPLQLIPATDWFIWRLEDGEDAPWSAPIVAWVLRADGTIVPAEADNTGWMEVDPIDCLTSCLRHASEGPPGFEWLELQRRRAADNKATPAPARQADQPRASE